MKQTVQSDVSRAPQNSTRSRPAPPQTAASGGYLTQLAAMMNNSSRVQAQRQLASEINGDHSDAAPSFAQAHTTPVQREEDEFPAQREPSENDKSQLNAESHDAPAQLAGSPAPNRTGLPDQLKGGVENLSGLSLDDVKVHYNSAKPAQLNALAYAQGTDIYVGPGQERHLPHESWHIVQQKQGRVRPTMQMKQGVLVNDDQGLEKEADVMGAKAAAGPAADSSRPVEQLRSTGGEVQRKKQISGAHDFADKGVRLGRMTVDFEERTRGSSAGMYGTIAFDPSPRGKPAKKIDLVQIASLTTNKKGTQQAEVDAGHRASVDKNIEETDIETSGKPEIKDMVRGGTREGFHIDLTFDKSVPRTSASTPVYESAYNAERRGGRWRDPFNIAKMSKDDTVLNEYSLRDEQVNTRKIDQDPGSNDGKGREKKTELQDFPVSSEASIFSFQTEVEADGQSWGTASWGFTTLMNLSEEAYVNTTQGPAFHSGRTEEMQEALMNFNSLLANPGAFTSPEVLASTMRLLTSKEKSSHTQGRADLITMGKELYWALNRINRFSQKKSTALKMAGPHFDTAREVLKLATSYEVGDEIFSELTDLCDEISRKLAEHD